MKPLSMMNFIRGSIRKILPLTITLCLAVSLLYFLSMINSQLKGQIQEVNLNTLENVSMLFGRGTTLTSEDIDRLNNEKIKQWYKVKVYDVTYNMALGGYTSALVAMVAEDDMVQLMEHQNVKLIQGEIPRRPNEIIIHRKMAANKDVTIGTIIEKDSKGWRNDEELTVVGFFEGHGVFGLGVEDRNKIEDSLFQSIFLIPIEGELEGMNEYIEKNFSSSYQITTRGMAANWLKKFQGPMDGIMVLIGIVLVFVLSVLLGNISMIQYSQRTKEFELLHAIGYTKKYISYKILKEIGVSTIIGYIVGIIIAILVGWIVNICFWAEKAMDMPLIQFKSIVTMLIVPIIITLSSMIAPVKMLRFKDII